MVDRGKRVARRQRDDLFAPAVEERIGATKGALGPRCTRAAKAASISLSLLAFSDMQFSPKRIRRCLHVPADGVGIGIGRIHKQADDRGLRHRLVQQLQPLRRQLAVKGHAGDVAARPVEAGDQAMLDRVVADVRTRSESSRSPPSPPVPQRCRPRRSPPPGGATRSAASAGSRSYCLPPSGIRSRRCGLRRSRFRSGPGGSRVRHGMRRAPASRR